MERKKKRRKSRSREKEGQLARANVVAKISWIRVNTLEFLRANIYLPRAEGRLSPSTLAGAERGWESRREFCSKNIRGNLMKISRGRLSLSHVPVILCIDRFRLTVCQRLFVCARTCVRAGAQRGTRTGGEAAAAFVRYGAFAFPSRKSLTSLALSHVRVSVIPRANARLPTEQNRAATLLSYVPVLFLLPPSPLPLPPRVFPIRYSPNIRIISACCPGLFPINVATVVRLFRLEL